MPKTSEDWAFWSGTWSVQLGSKCFTWQYLSSCQLMVWLPEDLNWPRDTWFVHTASECHLITSICSLFTPTLSRGTLFVYTGSRFCKWHAVPVHLLYLSNWHLIIWGFSMVKRHLVCSNRIKVFHLTGNNYSLVRYVQLTCALWINPLLCGCNLDYAFIVHSHTSRIPDFVKYFLYNCYFDRRQSQVKNPTSSATTDVVLLSLHCLLLSDCH